MAELELAGPVTLSGRLRVPGDKGISHRALLLAAVAEGTSVVRGVSTGDDVSRTARAVQAMGAVLDGERIDGGVLEPPGEALDCGNSATTMRLLAGLCAGMPWEVALVGDGSLSRRPMGRVIDPLGRMGAHIEGQGEGGTRAPLVVRGGHLRGIEYTLPVASAQVKSAVLLAGLHAVGETVVIEPVATRPHTEELLALAGADIDVESGRVCLRPSSLAPFVLDVPADPSTAAFWVVAALLCPGSELVLEQVYVGPTRSGYLDVLERMGAVIERVPTGHRTADLVVRGGTLHGVDIAGAEVEGREDEIPVLAVAAAFAEGTTTFRDAAELRVKETDRVVTTAAMLRAFGASVEERPDGLVVHGGAALHPGVVDSAGDHRIALAGAVAALAVTGTSVITGWEAAAISYPQFEEDLARCG